VGREGLERAFGRAWACISLPESRKTVEYKRVSIAVGAGYVVESKREKERKVLMLHATTGTGVSQTWKQ
jgi:hypothetical protein